MTDRNEAAYVAYRDELIAAGILIPLGVPGLYGKGEIFESIYRAVDNLVTAAGSDASPTILRFPPMISRTDFMGTDYLKSFPNLIGSIESFAGGDLEHSDLLKAIESGEDWTRYLAPTDVVLVNAACYPLYPTLRGSQLSDEGRVFDVLTNCFRHEPSSDPARMQSFHQHEFVRVGDPSAALKHRDHWLERGLALMNSLGLPVRAEIANDPFFGRVGRMLAANQREEALKYEIVVPICSEERPTAIVSCNCHEDHFGAAFDISVAAGPAHSACVGFGLERITLALLKHHGFDPSSWPSNTRAALWP